MEPADKEAAPRNAAAFKLATLETCAADPLMKPIDVALLTAYLKFMKWPKRTAYMPNIKARVLTGTKSEETISISRARLVRHGYLRKVMDKLNGSAIYEVNNPRAEIVADHVQIAEEKLKEMDAYRKAKSRKRPRKIRDADQEHVTENPGDTSRIIRDNSLESVRRLCDQLQSLRIMRRMDASLRKASAFALRHSQSLARRRQRPSHAKVRSTTQRLGRTTKPLA